MLKKLLRDLEDFFKQIPKISSPDFIPSLLKICKEYKIDILIPTIDTELKTIAENVEKFSFVKTSLMLDCW